jgi:hypothetical protein
MEQPVTLDLTPPPGHPYFPIVNGNLHFVLPSHLLDGANKNTAMKQWGTTIPVEDMDSLPHVRHAASCIAASGWVELLAMADAQGILEAPCEDSTLGQVIGRRIVHWQAYGRIFDVKWEIMQDQKEKRDGKGKRDGPGRGTSEDTRN